MTFVWVFILAKQTFFLIKSSIHKIQLNSTQNSSKNMVRQLTYSYLLLLRPLTNFSINLSMEKRHDPLSFFSMEHSIIAMWFLFFSNNCQYVLHVSERVSLWWSKRQVQKRNAFRYVQNILAIIGQKTTTTQK